jgi:hypothetical protein
MSVVVCAMKQEDPYCQQAEGDGAHEFEGGHGADHGGCGCCSRYAVTEVGGALLHDGVRREVTGRASEVQRGVCSFQWTALAMSIAMEMDAFPAVAATIDVVPGHLELRASPR